MSQILNYFYMLKGNAQYLGILLLAFLAAALLVWALSLMTTEKDPGRKRLSRMLPWGSRKESAATHFIEDETPGLVGKITAPLHHIALPSEDVGKKKLKLALVQAGFRSKRAHTNFISLKVLLGITFPLIFMISTMFYKLDIELLSVSLLLALAGYFLPNAVLQLLIRKRQKIITHALPDALDLMVICVESGLGLDMTFKRVGDEIRALSEDLSDEYYLVNREVRAGRPREECFRNMSMRTGVPEVHNLMTILTQTSRFGTSVAKALRIHADAMRIKRRQIAEETAAKAAVKLVFPLVMFIFPAIFVVLAGPAVIRIMSTLFPALGD